MDPQYAFSVPSMEDDIPLDCRIYHSKDLALPLTKAAVIAHPYAPLGGSYDDHVVMAVTETLLKQGYVVETFNFRGAGESAGRTTWTGKAEIQDYMSVTGFLVYYLHNLRPDPDTPQPLDHHEQIDIMLGGYSYGSLILARLPQTSEIIQRFEAAEAGTAVAEIILRARTLAKQTRQAIQELQALPSPRGRTLHPEQSPTSPSKRASPMTVGGEETDPSDRRRSRDSRRSVDVIRRSIEVPHRIKDRIKHRPSDREWMNTHGDKKVPKAATTVVDEHAVPEVSTSYLFISPVLLPFSSTLCLPGAPTTSFSSGGDTTAIKQYLKHPTLTVFGSNDAFTSSKRLRKWAEKQGSSSEAAFSWSEIESAGHFWGERGVLHALQRRVAEWTKGLWGVSQDVKAE